MYWSGKWPSDTKKEKKRSIGNTWTKILLSKYLDVVIDKCKYRWLLKTWVWTVQAHFHVGFFQ